jgi:hypothetical protein
MRGVWLTRAGVIGVAISTLGILSSCGEPRATAPDTTATGTSTSSSPALIACPTNQTDVTTGVVGLLGGALSLDGSSISIQAGALTTPTLFQLAVPASAYMEIDVSAVGFQTFLFQDSVSVTIDYSRCNTSELDGEVLHVWHIDPVTKAFLEDMGGQDDKANHRITFKTNHLSGYAVAN